jgi:hypothetical protein
MKCVRGRAEFIERVSADLIRNGCSNLMRRFIGQRYDSAAQSGSACVGYSTAQSAIEGLRMG